MSILISLLSLKGHVKKHVCLFTYMLTQDFVNVINDYIEMCYIHDIIMTKSHEISFKAFCITEPLPFKEQLY